MTHLTQIQSILKAMEERCAAATPGPWFSRTCYDYYQGGCYIGHGPLRFLRGDEPGYKIPVPQVSCQPKDVEYFQQDVCRVEGTEADEVFLLSVRTDIPSLVKALNAAIDVIENARFKSTMLAGRTTYSAEQFENGRYINGDIAQDTAAALANIASILKETIK
jgi:hypothetical protein